MALKPSRIVSVEYHPNRAEIDGILTQLPSIDGGNLEQLAAAWSNSTIAAAARARALHPDSPLVVDILRAFEQIGDMFAEEMDGVADHATTTSDTTVTALKAVRDALAAAFARPVLPRLGYNTLIRPWRTVHPSREAVEPDLGPHADRVYTLLEGLTRLTTRCHDARAAELFMRLARVTATHEHTMRGHARETAWQAALVTSRRRLWALVRRTGIAGFSRACRACRRGSHRDDHEVPEEIIVAVREMCLDAACALLVADAIDDTLVDVLTTPVAPLLEADGS